MSTVIKSCEHKNNGLSVFIAEEAGNTAENTTNCNSELK